MKNTLLFICSTNILVRLLTVNMKNCLTPKNPKMCDPILVTLLKMRPHYSQSSRENATPSSGTSPLASYKEVPPPPQPGATAASPRADDSLRICCLFPWIMLFPIPCTCSNQIKDVCTLAKWPLPPLRLRRRLRRVGPDKIKRKASGTKRNLKEECS